MQASVYERFVDAAVGVARQLRQGPALGNSPVDCGAMCMPGLAEKVAQLVEEAVADGAKVCAHPAWQSPLCALPLAPQELIRKSRILGIAAACLPTITPRNLLAE